MKKLHFLAAAAAISIAAPSLAAPIKPGTRQAFVSTAGLDLTTAKGLKMLDVRIMHAASALCGIPSASDALGSKKSNRCRDAARIAATEQREVAVAKANKVRKDIVASAQ